MHIITHGLSCHSTKASKQSSSITLSLTNIFLNNTNDYLTILQLALFTMKFFDGLLNKCTIVRKGTSYPSNVPYGRADIRIGALNVKVCKDTYPMESGI